ncbi:hypothetical protein F5Y11DRAFT_322164 [Daldinia sp. FL1419]|nr:hypothetical protein F5Y11DRAFT_322164 [Daldinia sp. FL1419]
MAEKDERELDSNGHPQKIVTLTRGVTKPTNRLTETLSDVFPLSQVKATKFNFMELFAFSSYEKEPLNSTGNHPELGKLTGRADIDLETGD